MKWRFGGFFPLEQTTFLAVKKKKKSLHSWSSLWWQRVVKSFGPDSPVPMWGYFSLNIDVVLSVDEALIPQAPMLLHNSASVLNPAGYYLCLRGAAYPLVAYYIGTSRFQGEVLQ